jgi:hypothetical protein
MYFIDLIIILIIFFIKLITDFKRFLNFKYINYKIFKFEEFVNSNKYSYYNLNTKPLTVFKG